MKRDFQSYSDSLSPGECRRLVTGLRMAGNFRRVAKGSSPDFAELTNTEALRGTKLAVFGSTFDELANENTLISIEEELGIDFTDMQVSCLKHATKALFDRRATYQHVAMILASSRTVSVESWLGRSGLSSIGKCIRKSGTKWLRDYDVLESNCAGEMKIRIPTRGITVSVKQVQPSERRPSGRRKDRPIFPADINRGLLLEGNEVWCRKAIRHDEGHETRSCRRIENDFHIGTPFEEQEQDEFLGIGSLQVSEKSPKTVDAYSCEDSSSQISWWELVSVEIVVVHTARGDWFPCTSIRCLFTSKYVAKMTVVHGDLKDLACIQCGFKEALANVMQLGREENQ